MNGKRIAQAHAGLTGEAPSNRHWPHHHWPEAQHQCFSVATMMRRREWLLCSWRLFAKGGLWDKPQRGGLLTHEQVVAEYEQESTKKADAETKKAEKGTAGMAVREKREADVAV